MPGMCGRKPKPENLRIIEGNREHRKIKSSPKPKPIIPDCPESLSGQARKEWERLKGSLYRIGLLTESDLGAFEAYCYYYGRWYDSRMEIKNLDGVDDVEKARKDLIREIDISFDKMFKCLAEFGLSPVSRMRLGTTDKDDDESWEGLID